MFTCVRHTKHAVRAGGGGVGAKNREAVTLPVHDSGRCRAARACGACGVAVRARGTSLEDMLRVCVLPNRAAAHPAGRRISQLAAPHSPSETVFCRFRM